MAAPWDEDIHWQLEAGDSSLQKNETPQVTLQNNTDDEEQGSFVSQTVIIENTFILYLTQNKRLMKVAALSILMLLYGVYLGFAMKYNIDRQLLALTTFVVLVLFINLFFVYFGPRIAEWKKNPEQLAIRYIKRIKWFIACLLTITVLLFVFIDNRNQPYKLLSLFGLMMFILTAFIGSKSPPKVDCWIIVSSILLQFIFGLLILRWDLGLTGVRFLGDQVTAFLTHTDAGSYYVFGVNDTFAFAVMPVTIFFGACTQLLYYYGVIQVLIKIIGTIMEVLMGVGPAETFTAAANIFLGPNLSVLTVKSFLNVMTLSELHCIMTSGFSTVTGSLFGAYLSFGVDPSHLIAASFMSAPAALAIGKMFWPETENSSIDKMEKIKFPPPTEVSWLEAYTNGAWFGAKIYVSVLAALIAFVSILNFINATLLWFGERAGVANFTFELITSYLFIPISWLLGVRGLDDCRQVARLLGTKIFLTDLVGYSELGILIQNRKSGLLPAVSPRTEVIATYALCGFGSFPDMAICLGAMRALVPNKRSDFAQVALRAMIAGNLACYITACIAGLLYIE